MAVFAQKLLAYWEGNMGLLVRASLLLFLCSLLSRALGDSSYDYNDEFAEYEEEGAEYEEGTEYEKELAEYEEELAEYEEEAEYREEYSGLNCDDGLILPLWSPAWNLSTGDRAGRGLLYLCIFLYLVLGVCVYLNKMMESVETITSWMKKSSVQDHQTGKPQEIIVKIWNQSLANIFTVLVSTSPITLFCIVEILAKGFRAGELGPFAIVGSSAFNLFIAIGIAILAAPKDKTKKVGNLGALILIAVLMLVLYNWIHITLSGISYGQVDIWEPVVTMIFFLVILISMAMVTVLVGRKPKHDAALTDYKENYKLYKMIIEEITKQHAGISDNDLLQKVLEYGVGRRPKSWAYYLTRATNMLAGSRILENIEEEMEKEGHGLKTGSEKNVDEIALTMSSTEIMDDLKPKVDLILLRGNSACICDCQLWLQQFKNLVNFQDLGKFGPFYLIIHFLSLPWKFLAAFIPPATTLGGIVPLMMSWGSIFFILPFIYDIVSHLDCFILCQDSLAGFILVSITLNLPNLLAAKIAAAEEETADLPLICLLTGNCLTTSLGFWLPWFMASIYWESQGQVFIVAPDSLSLCIYQFLFFATVAFVIIIGRRFCAGGELGGSTVCKIITTVIFLLLWVLLCLLIILKALNILV